MNILKARAKRIDKEMIVYGKWAVGYPIVIDGKMYIADPLWMRSYHYKDPEPFRCVHEDCFDDVDPATLGYETGKLDKNGDMIYGGMVVVVGSEKRYNVWWSEHSMTWVLSKVDNVMRRNDLKKYESSDLEIVKGGE